MQQTALNLLAISIFLMTLSCLLSPILNFSPAIPAGTTLVLLGLATVDTLGWQGKGMTLLLDSVARLSPTHRQRVVHHEAGHFLTAYFLGIPIKSYTLNAWEAFRQGQPGFGGVAFDTQALEADTSFLGEQQLILDRFCTVWMAGITAETLVYGDAEGGEDDRQKLREALALFGVQESPAQKEAWATLQAQSLIEKYRQAYERLVEAMQERQSVTDCYCLLNRYTQEKDQ
jgi:hypothetical protein